MFSFLSSDSSSWQIRKPTCARTSWCTRTEERSLGANCDLFRVNLFLVWKLSFECESIELRCSSEFISSLIDNLNGTWFQLIPIKCSAPSVLCVAQSIDWRQTVIVWVRVKSENWNEHRQFCFVSIVRRTLFDYFFFFSLSKLSECARRK